MQIRCLCCHHAETFSDDRDAYQAGWQVKGLDQVFPLCPLCPQTCYLTKSHELAHWRWLVDGRPKEFEMRTCLDSKPAHPERLLDQVRTVAAALQNLF